MESICTAGHYTVVLSNSHPGQHITVDQECNECRVDSVNPEMKAPVEVVDHFTVKLVEIQVITALNNNSVALQ